MSSLCNHQWYKTENYHQDVDVKDDLLEENVSKDNKVNKNDDYDLQEDDDIQVNSEGGTSEYDIQWGK